MGYLLTMKGWRATTANTCKPMRQLLLLYLFFSKPGGIVGALVQGREVSKSVWQKNRNLAESSGSCSVLWSEYRSYHSCIIHVSFMYHSCMFQYISLIKHYQFLIWLICLLSSRALGMLLALNWSKDPGKFQGRATLDPPVPSCTCSATKSVSQPRCRLGRRLLRDWRRSAGLPGLRCRSANPANSDLSISSVSGVGQETSWIQGSWPIGWDYLRLLDTTRGCLIRAPVLACH